MDLTGKTVGVTRGTIEDSDLARIVPKDASVRRFDDNNATIGALLSGQVQLIATGSVVAATSSGVRAGLLPSGHRPEQLWGHDATSVVDIPPCLWLTQQSDRYEPATRPSDCSTVECRRGRTISTC